MLVKILGLVLIAVLAISVICFQDQKILTLTNENKILRLQLLVLKNQSEILTKRYEEVHEESKAEIEQSQKKVERILVTKVPKNCQDAVRWGLQQAKVFKR